MQAYLKKELPKQQTFVGSKRPRYDGFPNRGFYRGGYGSRGGYKPSYSTASGQKECLRCGRYGSHGTAECVARRDTRHNIIAVPAGQPSPVFSSPTPSQASVATSKPQIFGQK